MEKLKDLNELKHTLLESVKVEMAKGIEAVDTDEMGKVVDMIKDLASAEKDCMEAAYYELVAEAMDGGESERMGYDRWRYSSGRFAPKGRGTRSGYTPYMNDGRYMDERYTDGRYGYTPNNGRDGRSDNGRMGHTDKVDAAFDTMGEIWADADMETRKKMKRLVGDLYDEMEKSGV